MGRRLTVADSEFRERCDAAIHAASAGGLDALLVWGRGGGPLDGGADLLYLTDHYTAFPTIPDREDQWADRGFGAAVLFSDGRVVLVVDIGGAEDDAFSTEVVKSDDIVADIASILRGADPGAIGIVGSSVMTAAQSWRLAEAVPDLKLLPVDDLVGRLRMIKSPTEERLIREACKTGVRAMTSIMEGATAGQTEAEIVSRGAQIIHAAGGVVYNLFAETFGERRPHLRRRLPTFLAEAPIRDGDTFAVDMSGALNGYLFDFARSTVVGDTGRQPRLLGAAKATVEAVIAELSPGTTVGTAVRKGMDVLQESGFGDASTSIHALGHGLGLGWEGPWLLPDDETVIKPGMYIAVEKDLWIGAEGAAYENDVFITPDGPEVLTALEI